MLGIKSKTSLRLIIGFLFITLIIVMSTSLTFLYNIKKVDQTLAEITKRGETINDVLLTSFYIREKHEYQAHLIMSKDFSYETIRKGWFNPRNWPPLDS